MQSALVRKDSVMLHDPMRTHSRATAVGVIIGAIGMLGFLLFGILKAAPPVPSAGIVISKDSGQMYVKTEATANRPAMLIPTFNLASARLILMGQTTSAGGGQVQPSQVQVVEPEVVPDSRLEGIPRGRMQGIVDGPPLLPSADQRIEDHWAVCDNLKIDQSLTEDVNRAALKENSETAVLAGVAEVGTPLGENQAIFAENERGTYLIYRPAESANISANMVRAEIDMGDSLQARSVREALKLTTQEPRPVSSAVLDAIQPVDPLKPLSVPGEGGASGFDLGGANVTVGGVFQVSGTTGVEYYLLTRDGKQKVSQAVAEIIRANHVDGSGGIPEVLPNVLSGIPTVTTLPLDYYPAKVPEVLDPLMGHSAMCLGWTVVGEDEAQNGRTTVYVGPRMPLPKDEQGKEVVPYKVGQANAKGSRIDSFYMPPGRAAVVHAATGQESFQSGPLSLVSDRGMRFDIPDLTTAAFLGLNDARPAPEAIVGLLPGASKELSVQAAQQTFDSVAVDPDSVQFGQNTEASGG